MFSDQYKSELDKIKVSEIFKKNITKKMIDYIDNDINLSNNRKQIFKKGAVAIIVSFTLVGTLSLAYLYPLRTVSKPEQQNEHSYATNLLKLPLLTVQNEQNNGMGYEALMAYNIKDLENDNPWTESSNITSLPVYKNTTIIDNNSISKGGLSLEDMKNIVGEITDSLGVSVNSIEKDYNRIVAYCNKTQINVESDGTVVIRFDPALPVESKQPFGSEINTEEAKKVTELIVKKYWDTIDIGEYCISVSKDYNFDGKMNLTYEVYPNSTNLIDKIIGFNFKTIQFCPDDAGKLFLIRIFNKDLSEKIGDYPIISSNDAQKLLIAGNYLTSITEEFPGVKYIANVELIYSVQSSDDVFMPFYKFYIEQPTLAQSNGLKTYGIYYVPAVKKQYLKELPKVEVNFN